ncbi:MAG: S-layer homology domain-containing protein [Synergistaceae bacterium]|jgi:hypothetical protein|nr:S-layer homology domain-containing protein [Synergistaceae bacterium]
MKKFLIAVAIVALAAFAVPAFAATNPFMDVPASHWAFDAVAQLAARGVISGYPDGSFKGPQPSTRYEVASIIARTLAKIDLEKASKQDVEMLKALVVEFADELNALGVRVDSLDSRVAILEHDIGGWSMAGQLRFDAKLGADDETKFYQAASLRGENEFDLNRYRLFIRKRIDENSRFELRIGPGTRGGDAGAGVNWELYHYTTKLPYDITFDVGRNYFEWEMDLGLAGDIDTVVGGFYLNGFWFKKDWGLANLQLIIGRRNDDAGFPEDGADLKLTRALPGLEQFYVAGLANFNINESFSAGVLGYYFLTDNEISHVNGSNADSDTDLLTVGLYAKYKFTPAIELDALYYYQDQGDSYTVGTTTDASLWRVILKISQDALKFTSLRFDYGQWDNNFVRFGNYSYAFTAVGGPDILGNQPLNTNSTTVYGVRADQKWNAKWSTFERYFVADYDTVGYDDAATYTLGFTYQMNPAVQFQLAYDAVDYGEGTAQTRQKDEGIFRFRTFINF